MKNILTIITVFSTLFFFSCSSQDRLVKIEYCPSKESSMFYMELPPRYKIINVSSIEERERRFIYPDSSFIYISSFFVSPNYYNIKALGDSIYNYRFQNKILLTELSTMSSNQQKLLPDTFELSGISKNGLFWKDIYIGDVSIGYRDVPNKQKVEFDNFLRSLRIKYR